MPLQGTIRMKDLEDGSIANGFRRYRRQLTALQTDERRQDNSDRR